MAFGNEWEEEMKLASENGGDAEKLLHHYIYDRLKKKNLHDVAEIFAQEANLEESQLVRCNENLLTEWWEVFWPTFCSIPSNKAGANGQSSGQPSMVNALGQLAAEPSLVAEAFGNKRLSPVGFLQSQAPFHADNMHYTMPPSNRQSHLQLPAAMETPAQVTKDPKNDGLGRSDQMELTRPVGPNSAYTIIEHHAGLPAAQALEKGPLGFPPVQLRTTRNTPVPPLVNPSHLQMPFTIQPPPQVARAPRNDVFPERSVQVESTYTGGQGSTYSQAAPYAGLPAAQALEKGPLGFPPVQLHTTRNTAVPPLVNPSHLQMPFTIQPPPKVARAPRNDVFPERSVQVESTYPGGQGSTYSPAAPYAGEANCKNQLPLTGVRMGVPGPDLVSYESRVPASFLQLMHQAEQMRRAGSNLPPVESSKEVQEGSETLRIRRGLENIPNSEEGNGTAN